MKPIFLKPLRLISKARLKAGFVRAASSSDGIVDTAAAAELGLIERDGLVSLIPPETRARARRLLKANVLWPVDVKKSTLDGSSLKSIERRQFALALHNVIGLIYLQEQVEKGFSFTTILNRGKFAKWVMKEIKIDTSRLNIELTRNGYLDIVGLVRSKQWWERSFQ